MRRTVVALDLVVRVGLVWLLALGIWRLTRSCAPEDVCDDPGLGTLFVVRFAMYLVWNLAVIVVVMFVVRPSTQPWAAGVLALVAIPRLVVLVALTSGADTPWPLVVLFSLTVVSQVVAFVDVVRGSRGGDGQSSA